MYIWIKVHTHAWGFYFEPRPHSIRLRRAGYGLCPFDHGLRPWLFKL